MAFAPGAELVEVVEDDGGGERYALVAGDRDIPIWSADTAVDGWDLATRVTLAVLNDLLTAHGSPERAFAVLGGTICPLRSRRPRWRASSTPRPRWLHDGTGRRAS